MISTISMAPTVKASECHKTKNIVVRVKWGKMGHFFDYFFNIS